MTREIFYLALDQGSHASRAVLFDEHGALISSGSCPLATRYPQPNWVEHDPEEVVESLRRAIRNAVTGHKIIAAGLATQRSSIVCWNRETGRALSPVISWRDRRAAAWMDGFSQYRDEIYARTGLFPSAHYGVSKLHWCLHHLPDVNKALKRDELAWGPLASFLLFRLLEQHPLLADPGNASRTLLWNRHKLDWDAHLLEMFALPAAALPQCVPSRHAFGHLDISGRKVPVQIVMGDLPASLFAAGPPQANIAYINVGTGAFVQRLMRTPAENAGGFPSAVAYQDAHGCVHVLEGTVNGAGSALAWFEGRCGIHGIVENLPEWLQRKMEPPLFLNGVSGLGSPFWRPAFASRFAGDGKPCQQAVAVLESIIFLLQLNMEGMAAYATPPRQIRISGGLAQLDGFCQRLANLAGVPALRPASPEATACGCAFLLAHCPADWREADADSLFQPQPDTGLRHRYKRWKILMETTLHDS